MTVGQHTDPPVGDPGGLSLVYLPLHLFFEVLGVKKKGGFQIFNTGKSP